MLNRDREMLIAAASEFIESQNVTHYFTLTYPRRVSWEGRHKRFREWLDAIEWMQKRPLGWLRADENRFSGLGFPEIPEHHHGLLVDTDHLCSRTAEHLWRAFGDARVERYERHGGAIPYCLKHAFNNIGEWDIGGKGLRSIPGLVRIPAGKLSVMPIIPSNPNHVAAFGYVLENRCSVDKDRQ